MRDDLPAGMEEIWRSGQYIGKNRPITRITVQRPKMSLHTLALRSTFRRVPATTGKDISSFSPYPSGINPDKGESVTNTYADYLFSPPAPPLEFPNVRNVDFSNSVDVDVAEVTIKLWNTRPLPVGTKPTKDDFDQPGFYSFGRGTSAFSSRWGHQPNAYAALLVPDNIVRVYQGYGSDLLHDTTLTPQTCPPEKDSRLTLTGTWQIDEIDYDDRGNLVVRGRDMGRLLIDHMAFLPVIPPDFYPLTFEGWGDRVTVQKKFKKVVDTTRRGKLPFKLVGSGNDRWPESAYLGAGRHGHKLAHAADGKLSTYWLSVGNPKPTYRSAYEYVDLEVGKLTVEQLRVRTMKTGYVAYVSVKQNGKWMPGREMPYRRDGRGRYDEGVPYVASATLRSDREYVIDLGSIPKVTLVRLWLGNTQDFGLPGARWRAGIREVSLYGVRGSVTVKRGVDSTKRTLTPGPAGANPGRVQDLTDIVKLLCAWAGLYWPGNAIVRHSDGSSHRLQPKTADKDVLGKSATGRVWGDFQETGTAPLVQILAGNFDKRSLMECIGYVRDMVGFLFTVDHAGAVQWRQPNVWEAGNWIAGMSARPGRTSRILSLDEKVGLRGLGVNIQSRNVREQIFVGNLAGKQAAMVGGFNPNDTGLRRVAGWTDQNFATVEESTVMADLIAVRQMFKYRTDSPQIAAFPGIQIDDQVRIFERVTSEGFIHYVKGISSSFDAVTGQWTYTLQTHWLGDDPKGAWVVRKSSLSKETVEYVDALVEQGPEWSRAGLEV